MKMINTVHRTTVVVCLLLGMAGCKSIGPRTVARDRFDYSDAIGESWKRQTLLNIVKLRYLDPPIFVDVGQIVAGYTLELNASVGGSFETGPNNSLALGGSTKYTDRPTVTYTPLTGNKFIKSLMTPLPPESVFSLIQSGWPADGVLVAALSAMNGLKNQGASVKGTTPPDKDFLRVLELMRRIQLAGGVAVRVQVDAQKQQTVLLTIRRSDLAEETRAECAEVRRLLRLDPDASEFKLVLGATAVNDKEVAVATRSILQLMATMAANVEIPAQDLADHRAPPGWESVSGTEGVLRLIEIHSAKDKPANAFVAVGYRGLWFWIDDRDLKSKRVFSFMMMLFTLADTADKEPLPMITIPAQ